MNIPLLIVFLASPYVLYYLEKKVVYPLWREVGRSGRKPSIVPYHVAFVCFLVGITAMYLGF